MELHLLFTREQLGSQCSFLATLLCPKKVSAFSTTVTKNRLGTLCYCSIVLLTSWDYLVVKWLHYPHIMWEELSVNHSESYSRFPQFMSAAAATPLAVLELLTTAEFTVVLPQIISFLFFFLSLTFFKDVVQLALYFIDPLSRDTFWKNLKVPWGFFL